MDCKIEQTILVSTIMALELFVLNSPFYWRRILVIMSPCVNKQSRDFRHYQDKHFGTEVLSERWKILKKLLSCIFQRKLGRFNMLTVLVYTETWLFRHLHNHVFYCL